MHTPQIIMIVLMGIGLGRAVAKHGEPDTPINAGSTFISAVISAALLWWGGFWG